MGCYWFGQGSERGGRKGDEKILDCKVEFHWMAERNKHFPMIHWMKRHRTRMTLAKWNLLFMFFFSTVGGAPLLRSCVLVKGTRNSLNSSSFSGCLLPHIILQFGSFLTRSFHLVFAWTSGVNVRAPFMMFLDRLRCCQTGALEWSLFFGRFLAVSRLSSLSLCVYSPGQ